MQLPVSLPSIFIGSKKNHKQQAEHRTKYGSSDSHNINNQESFVGIKNLMNGFFNKSKIVNSNNKDFHLHLHFDQNNANDANNIVTLLSGLLVAASQQQGEGLLGGNGNQGFGIGGIENPELNSYGESPFVHSAQHMIEVAA